MNQNLYFDYRYRASKSNRLLKNRARAAELLGISESSLSNYETGKTKCVPPEMVAQMATIYNAPELRNVYCKFSCPIGCHKNLALTEEPIEKVAVHLVNCTDPKRLSVHISRFLEIAGQGNITEAERKALQEIAEILDTMNFTLSEFFIFAERQGAISWD